MESDKKFYKYDKIRKFEKIDNDCMASYKDAIDAYSLKVFKFAATKGYLRSANDAPRGGKYGEHFEVLKFFTFDSMKNKMEASERRLNRALKKVLKSEIVSSFSTLSKIANFRINGELYSNFSGYGENIVEVCTADADAFKVAKMLTRRQVFNADADISVVKFDKAQPLNIDMCDDAKAGYGVKTIPNALGFVIWARKVKVFISK